MGCGTVAINYLSYVFCESILGIYYLVSIAIAWLCSFLFAFVTNKLFVFQSREVYWKQTLREVCGFLTCRVFSLVVELALMFFSVTFLSWNDKLMKLVVNGVVILINYIGSKRFVFRRR